MAVEVNVSAWVLAEPVPSCAGANLRGSGEIRGPSLDHLIRLQQQ